MSFLSRIKAFFNKNRDYHRPSLELFYKLDHDAIAENLNIDEQAKRRGEQNQPDSNATSPDNIEQEIIHICETTLNENYSIYLDQLKGYQSRQAAINPEAKSIEINEAANNALSEFNTEAKDGKNQLVCAKKQLKAINNELKNFKIENQINRTANYPNSTILHIGFIALLLLFECFINTTFFAEGNTNGLIGGFIEALTISGINVFVGFCAGIIAFRRFNHVKMVWKVTSVLLMLVYILFTFTFNLFVAHYRIAMGGEQPDLASQLAATSFMQHPFHLNDFNSIILIVLGLIFSILSAIDGYKINDPYPGYGNIDKKFHNALDEYNEQHRDIIENLKEIKDEAIHNFHQAKNNLEEFSESYENLIDQKNNLNHRYKANIQDINSCANRLIKKYREINKSHRNTPAPKYFDNLIELNTGSISPIIQNNDTNIEHNNINNVYQHLDKTAKKMHEQFLNFQNEFQLINDVIGDENE